MLSRSTSTVIYMINDYLEIASVFRSHGFTIRTIYPDDMHSRHEVLANITEGGVMGVILGLIGPKGTAPEINANRNRKKEKHARRDHDARKQQKLVEDLFS
jgi:hypothetical protein